MACFDARVEMFYAAHGKTQAECRAMPAVPEGVLQHYKRSAKELGPADYSGLAHAGAIGHMRYLLRLTLPVLHILQLKCITAKPIVPLFLLSHVLTMCFLVVSLPLALIFNHD